MCGFIKAKLTNSDWWKLFHKLSDIKRRHVGLAAPLCGSKWYYMYSVALTQILYLFLCWIWKSPHWMFYRIEYIWPLTLTSYYRRVVEDLQHHLPLLGLLSQQVKEAAASGPSQTLAQHQWPQGLHHSSHWRRLAARGHKLLLLPWAVQTLRQPGQRTCRGSGH